MHLGALSLQSIDVRDTAVLPLRPYHSARL